MISLPPGSASNAPRTGLREGEVDAVLIGLGGLGCPAAWALAQSAGSLRLVDEDRVERSNLHRQVLFAEGDIGRLKVEAAADALRGSTHVAAIATHIGPENARELLRGARVVLEGTDNLAAKFLVSDAARALGIPVVHGACAGWQATVLTAVRGRGACYRCLFEAPPDDEAGSCVTAGIFGPVTSVAGALMAADATRILRGDLSMAGSVARYDGLSQTFRASRFEARGDCPCVTEPSVLQGDLRS